MKKQAYVSPELLKIMVVEQDVICTSTSSGPVVDDYDNIGQDNN